MTSILDIFNTQVTESGNTITVTYCHNEFSGTCIYKRVSLQGKTKRFKLTHNILINTEMEDIIEYLYKQGEITGDGDLERIRYEIQTHSRNQVEGSIFLN